MPPYTELAAVPSPPLPTLGASSISFCHLKLPREPNLSHPILSLMTSDPCTPSMALPSSVGKPDSLVSEAPTQTRVTALDHSLRVVATAPTLPPSPFPSAALGDPGLPTGSPVCAGA